MTEGVGGGVVGGGVTELGEEGNIDAEVPSAVGDAGLAGTEDEVDEVLAVDLGGV